MGSTGTMGYIVPEVLRHTQFGDMLTLRKSQRNAANKKETLQTKKGNRCKYKKKTNAANKKEERCK